MPGLDSYSVAALIDLYFKKNFKVQTSSLFVPDEVGYCEKLKAELKKGRKV